jgi:hypothetical protein
MSRKNRATVAVAVAASLADKWLQEVLPNLQVVRAEPIPPHVTGLNLLIEKDQQNNVNGANIQFVFGPGRPEKKNKHRAASELWVSREIKLEEDGKYSLPPVLVSRACGLNPRGNMKASGSAVSLRFGEQGSGSDTYFASDVPSTIELDNLMADAIKSINENPELLEEFKNKGWLKAIKGRERITHIIEFPASKIGYTPFLFCPIGKDGNLIVNPHSDQWSSSRLPGLGLYFTWGTDEAGNLTGVPVMDRMNNRRQQTRRFRGQVFSRGQRSKVVSDHLLREIKASPIWKQISEIKGIPFAGRAQARNSQNSGGNQRFGPSGPGPMEAPSGNFAPSNTEDNVVNPAEVGF